MIPLLNIRSSYSDGNIDFKWDLPKNPPDTVYICPIEVRGNEQVLKQPFPFRLKNGPYGWSWQVEGRNLRMLKTYKFLIFLMQGDEKVPYLEPFKDDPRFAVTVVAGNAAIFYDVKTKPVGGHFYKHDISVSTEDELPHGVLLYEFNSGGQRFTQAFPGRVCPAKKHTYDPFYTFNPPGDMLPGITVEVISDAKLCVQLTKKRLSWFSWFPR